MGKVRPARPDDEAAVQTLATAFATSFLVRPETVRKIMPALLARDDACLLAVESRGVVGYLLGFLHHTFYANGWVGWVEELMVASLCRRQGLGGLLMREFERWAAARGGRVVALATRRASEFYRAIGYEDSAVYLRKMIRPE
jgi:GNAT superfamily N-acetyltransferase